MIHKHAPRGSESGFVLIFFADMDLVITRKSIHEVKDFMTGTSVNDLVNKQSGEFVFGKIQIQFTEVSIDANGTLFFIDGNNIRNPSGIHDGVYEACFAHFFYLNFDGRGF